MLLQLAIVGAELELIGPPLWEGAEDRFIRLPLQKTVKHLDKPIPGYPCYRRDPNVLTPTKRKSLSDRVSGKQLGLEFLTPDATPNRSWEKCRQRDESRNEHT